MAVRGATITVTGASPVVIASANKSDDGINAGVTVAGVTVYFGGDDMTNVNYATKGVAVAPGGALSNVFLPYGDILFGFAPTGSATVSVLQTGV